MKTVWVNGCFDILHVGHIELFKYAKSLGDKLIVGIDTDDRVKKLKGDTRPINTCDDRLKMLSTIKYIDEVVSFSSDIELTYFIKKYDTDVLVVGSDYIGKNIIGSEYVGDVIYFNRISDYSTTKIINNIYDEKKN